MLYVFSGPGRLAGTTLLMHDTVATTEPDSMWLYLRAFGIFKKLDAAKQQVLVPTLKTFTATRPALLEACRELFEVVTSGAVRINIGQRFPLREAARAQGEIESRTTVGSTVLIPDP